MRKLIDKIGQTHARLFEYVSNKAKTSRVWAVLLTILVIYELVEHLVYPWLVPWLAYMAIGK